MKKYLTISILLIMAVLFEISVFGFFSSAGRYFNPLLIIIVFLLLLSSLKNTFICAFVFGFFLDLYSVLNFGLYLAAFFLMIIFVYYFFQKYITNRSLYSFFILTAISTLLFYLTLVFFSFLIYASGLADYAITFNLSYLFFILIQAVLNSLLAVLVFILINYVSNKLKSNFILKDHYYGQR